MSEIKHYWNDSVLTIASDSGISSADLRGPKGDTGPRGPQGPGGVIYDEDGKVIVNLGEYYSKSEVDDLINSIDNAEIDLSEYATKAYVSESVVNAMTTAGVADKTYVNEQIAANNESLASKDYVATEITEANKDMASKDYVVTEITRAQLEGAEIDTSNFATKAEVNEVAAAIPDVSGFVTQKDIDDAIAAIEIPEVPDPQPSGNVEIDGISIIRNKQGQLSAAVGGGISDSYVFYGVGINLAAGAEASYSDLDKSLAPGTNYSYKAVISGYDDVEGTFIFSDTNNGMYNATLSIANTPITSLFLIVMNKSNGTQTFYIQCKGSDAVLTDFFVWEGVGPATTYTPINANFIPIDNETIVIRNGKLCVVGGTGGGVELESSEEVNY